MEMVHGSIMMIVTPLIQAILNGQMDIITILLEFGAVKDYRVPKLIKSSAISELHQHFSNWLTPLHVAVLVNNIHIIRLLLCYGASPNVVDSMHLYFFD